MKAIIYFLIALSAVFTGSHILHSSDLGKITPMQMVENIHWLGQAAFKISTDDKIIYIDPLDLKKKDKADIILITHGHFDHLSEGDIKKVACEKTVLIGPESCTDKLDKFKVAKLVLLNPGQSHDIDNIHIEAVPAYNVKKTDFHPQSNKWLGYIMTINGVKIYHAGDTERIPEMKNFTCDIALLPLGQTYTMNSVDEAAQTALDVQAKIAIPMHFGQYEGTKEDAEKFKALLQDKVHVVIKNLE